MSEPIPCQRWREHRSLYRPAGEPIDVRRYGVEIVEERQARAFVVDHHYSGSFPAARLSVGLFRARAWITPELVGVAVFSVPMQQRVIPALLGVEPSEGVELGRFVLRDDVEANGESWFLPRAFSEALRVLGVRGIVAYSDPMERRTAEGHLVKPGHVGIIYRATNARYVGRSSSRWLWLAPNGEVVNGRMLSKLRNDEQGAAYAYRQLTAWGAPTRRLGEDSRAYADRALAEGPFRRTKHPGNFAYVWALGDRRIRRDVLAGMKSAVPLPDRHPDREPTDEDR